MCVPRVPSRARRWAPETAEVADTLRAADLPPQTAEATAQVLVLWEQVRASATCQSKMSSPSSGQGRARRRVRTTNKGRVDDLGLSRGAGDENRTRALSLGISGPLSCCRGSDVRFRGGQINGFRSLEAISDRCCPLRWARMGHE
ncbi:DUF1932 domain-containing protein [Streptomyces sp. NPDC005951]|uniref:DUF1932 domain-containing protein n=1 Tax=Streptomyces sp. NPDC005951 TaxID=3154573 RepID=UPI0033E16147